MSILSRLRPVLTATLALVLMAGTASARCAGTNLLDHLDPADSLALEAATAAQPFARGNLWQATRGGASVTLLGTYHMADPRHEAVIDRMRPLIAEATALLVEAGPEEERALKRDIAETPALLFLTEGDSLMQQMPAAEWQRVAAALAARKIPPFMGAKMRPWYLATMLAIAPCDMAEVSAGRGLDHRVMDLATEAGRPIRALEPHTTLFRIFDRLTPEQQLEMLRSSLVMEDRVADFAITLSAAYFAEDSRRMWEYLRLISGRMPDYTPARADAEFALMEEALMTERNRAWIPVIEEVAADGPAVVAFGALHLPGQEGVLNLLQQEGWTITPLDVQ